MSPAIRSIIYCLFCFNQIKLGSTDLKGVMTGSLNISREASFLKNLVEGIQ